MKPLTRDESWERVRARWVDERCGCDRCQKKPRPRKKAKRFLHKQQRRDAKRLW